MADTLRDIIITSPAADWMLNNTTPIYDNSKIALYMFEGVGREFDKVNQILEELPAQLDPETATWLLPLWERRYGLPTDETVSLEERRRKIRLRQHHTGAFNPQKIIELAENLTGVTARVVEHVGPYTFAVYLSATSASDDALRRQIKKLKPSHKSFEIRYEQNASNVIDIGGNINWYKHFELNQVN